MIDRSINDLPLSNRAKNALWRGGYRTMRDLLDAQDNELLRCVGIGRYTLAEVRYLISMTKHATSTENALLQDVVTYGVGITIDGLHVPYQEWIKRDD